MQFRISLPTGLAVFALILSACAPALPSPEAPTTNEPLSPQVTESQPIESPTPEPSVTPGSGMTGEQVNPDLPVAVQAAVRSLSAALNLASTQIEVVSYEEATWPDSCLGLSTAGEMCLQVLTPGYRVFLEVDGKEYELHTDAKGVNVRQKGLLGEGGLKPGLDKPVVVLLSMRTLSETLGVPIDEIQVVSTEKVDWPDSCLGLPAADEVCAEAITPGFRIILAHAGKEYEFHTDLAGENIRQK